MAHPDQSLPYWLQRHVHAFQHSDGVRELVVPVNAKTDVTTASWYESVPNPNYADLAAHDDKTILAARPRRTQDKAIAGSRPGCRALDPGRTAAPWLLQPG